MPPPHPSATQAIRACMLWRVGSVCFRCGTLVHSSSVVDPRFLDVALNDESGLESPVCLLLEDEA